LSGADWNFSSYNEKKLIPFSSRTLLCQSGEVRTIQKTFLYEKKLKWKTFFRHSGRGAAFYAFAFNSSLHASAEMKPFCALRPIKLRQFRREYKFEKFTKKIEVFPPVI
jgi:hypothetical protein